MKRLATLVIVFSVCVGSTLFAQSDDIESEKIDDVLIERCVVGKLSVFSDESGAALVEHARQNDVAAEATARAARRTLGEIGRGDVRCVGHD